MKFGPFTMNAILDGYLSLDGGAMFGVVPKLLWDKVARSDAKNRVRCAMRALLVDSAGKKVLVNTGMGDKADLKSREIYAVEREGGIVAELNKLGISPDKIDLVINTHLHFDHCGGNTYRDSDGKIRATFPRATYLAQRGEYEEARKDTARNRASYLLDDFQPLVESGQMELLEGDGEILPGISVVVVPGHTRHLQCVKISWEDKTLFHPSDLIPTSYHLPFSWVMAYDLYPAESLENKRKILLEAAAKNWALFFEHDLEESFGYVELKEGRPRLRPICTTFRGNPLKIPQSGTNTPS